MAANNLYALSTDELMILLSIGKFSPIPGIDGLYEEDTLSGSDIRRSVDILQRKRYLTLEVSEENDEMQEAVIDNGLYAWLQVMTDSVSYYSLSVGTQKLIFYFYGDTIVTLEQKGEDVTIMWIPFIHIAVGQMLQFVDSIKEGNFSFCENGALDSSQILFDKNNANNELMTQITQILVKAHGEEIRKGL